MFLRLLLSLSIILYLPISFLNHIPVWDLKYLYKKGVRGKEGEVDTVYLIELFLAVEMTLSLSRRQVDRPGGAPRPGMQSFHLVGRIRDSTGKGGRGAKDQK